jgi:hypothetical protein
VLTAFSLLQFAPTASCALAEESMHSPFEPPGGVAKGDRKDACGPSRRGGGSFRRGTGDDYPRTASSSGRCRPSDWPPWTPSRSPPHDSRLGWYEAAYARYGGNYRLMVEHRIAGVPSRRLVKQLCSEPSQRCSGGSLNQHFTCSVLKGFSEPDFGYCPN